MYFLWSRKTNFILILYRKQHLTNNFDLRIKFAIFLRVLHFEKKTWCRPKKFCTFLIILTVICKQVVTFFVNFGLLLHWWKWTIPWLCSIYKNYYGQYSTHPFQRYFFIFLSNTTYIEYLYTSGTMHIAHIKFVHVKCDVTCIIILINWSRHCKNICNTSQGK